MMTNDYVSHIPYPRFKDAQAQLVNVVAIDYFFAKEMFLSGLLGIPQLTDGQEKKELLFHLLMALSESLRQGHSCLPLAEIANSRYGFQCDHDNLVTHHGYLFPDVDSINLLLCTLSLSPQAQQAVVLLDKQLFLRRYYLFEQEILAFIKRRCTETPASNQLDNKQLAETRDCLNTLFPKSEFATNERNSTDVDWQKIAVANALNKSFTIIAGGPGTGKTYTVTKLLAALIMQSNNPSLNIALAAPTGKAAQRLAESIASALVGFRDLVDERILAAIPKEAQTIHRLLGVVPNSPNFRHHQDNVLTIDILLIDEFSMVDLPLMTRLLRAVPTHCQLILLGDADQLPSVAAGSVLADLAPYSQTKYSIANAQFIQQVCGELPLMKGKKNSVNHVTFLTKSRRFDGKGEIGQLAKAVIAGDNVTSWQLLQNAEGKCDNQLTWLDNIRDLPSQVDQNKTGTKTSATNNIDWLKPLVQRYYQPIKHVKNLAQAFHLLSQFRVLAAMRKGETGVENLNQLIEDQINPSSYMGQSSVGSNALYHGKPIMINQNDYRLGLYNGDIGFIWRDQAGHLMAVFQSNNADEQAEQYLWLLPSRLPSYETVYAMTIHKTQGSEFDHVAMVLPSDTQSQLLSRELLYTGITRAKTQLTIQSNKAVWFHGVESEVNRHSGIKLTGI